MTDVGVLRAENAEFWVLSQVEHSEHRTLERSGFFNGIHPAVLRHINIGIYITLKNNKVLMISSRNATCFGPYRPSLGWNHDLKRK